LSGEDVDGRSHGFASAMQIWLNGREWLARTLNAKGIDHVRHDNCFTWLEDPGRPRA
jgi:hypothetical protein